MLIEQLEDIKGLIMNVECCELCKHSQFIPNRLILDCDQYEIHSTILNEDVKDIYCDRYEMTDEDGQNRFIAVMPHWKCDLFKEK